MATVAAPMAYRRRIRVTPRSTVLYTLLVLLALLFLFPFYIMVRNAFLTDLDITSPTFVWLPIPPHLENISELFSNPDVPMLTGLSNSAIVAVTQTVFQMLFASMAGYGLARIPFRGRGVVFGIILGTMMIPGAALFVPKYILVSHLGWVNTLQGIIVPDLFSAFSAFMFRQFFLDFPSELEEAGRVDGLGYWGLYRRIAVPNSLGITMALGVLAFINSWNAFLWPLVIGQNPSAMTVQVDISSYLTAQTINLHEIFLGSVVAIVPIVVVFLIMQRWIVEGVKLSGVKG
jgi:multiple sugar transport system permease protein